MQILQSNQNILFYGGNISKKSLMNGVNESRKNNLKKFVDKVSAPALKSSPETILKACGITYCTLKNRKINLAYGYNGGFYIINPHIDISDSFTNYITNDFAKIYIANSIVNFPDKLGGLTNYVNMVKKIKRQDIIQKALKIHTFEMNDEIDIQKQLKAANNLSKLTGINIERKDLFFINDETFYYDKPSNRVFSIKASADNLKFANSTLRTCEFILDNSGNTIGYNLNDWNFYRMSKNDYTYIEQQEPSVELKTILDNDNNVLLAEGYRFGNAKPTEEEELSMEIVVDFLKKRLNIKNLNKDNLQLVKFRNNDNIVNTRIGYYDPTLGTSFIFNKNGKFLHQLEYSRDSLGNIVSCTDV